MSSLAPSPKKSKWFARFGRGLGRCFMRGVLLLAPIVITVMVLKWVFVTVDGWLQPYVRVPGAGFALVVLALLLAGWVGSFLFLEPLIRWFNRLLDRLPGVNFIYSSIRDFFKAFVGNKRRFTHTVRVTVLADDVWMLGFLTDEDVREFELGADFVSVYVPQAYNIAGQLYMVRRGRVRSLQKIGPRDAMKYAVTGGAVETGSPLGEASDKATSKPSPERGGGIAE